MDLQKELERNKKMMMNLNRRFGNLGSADNKMVALNKDLPKQLKAGNLGEINRVIWPFFFTFSAPELNPSTGTNSYLTVTQEAAFIWMSMTKTVFKKVNAPVPHYEAIDANDFNDNNSNANELTVSLRDAQSSRFFTDQPLPLDMIGSAKNPTVLPTPQLLLPNASMEAIFQNDHVSNVYVPFITLFGYRLRLDNPNILSTIVG